MESIGFRYVVTKISRQWQLREYVDRAPVQICVALTTNPVGNLLQIQPIKGGWKITGLSISAPKHQLIAHALEALDWWVTMQP